VDNSFTTNNPNPTGNNNKRSWSTCDIMR
jgi:hypothetical protein